MARYKIVYDREACIAAFSCVQEAPQFWVENQEEAKADLQGGQFNDASKTFEREIDESQLEVAQRSADVCPVQAIKIVKLED
ncbi:ferredoxin [Candidatus Woesearchaeota archaeon]|nr:ferredoxin [Candidatus Woesearchaeota archaeon]